MSISTSLAIDISVFVKSRSIKRESRLFKSTFYDWSVVSTNNMVDSLPSDCVSCEEAVLVRVTWFNEAIGVHENGSWEISKLYCLIEPGCSEISN